ncbi:fumarylacetoacetate hydrolase family protein [Sphingobium sp.]|uniref:fumarylacetoacetate hydrolase family protein n=1 Tax=Sphingobium sp. TaxID=1912891 RepID=UPI0028BF17DD|nr:fumarylacetoacetate hydrolase family protein [Sphingobium sp.]
MHIELNATHDPHRKSWVDSANVANGDFPIQNLPFGLFHEAGRTRCGVALGDQIIDLASMHQAGILSGGGRDAVAAASGETLAPLLAMSPYAVSALRMALSNLFRADGAQDRDRLASCLVPMRSAQMLLPLRPTAFTDFCTSIDHIRRLVGTAPLAAMSLPIGYNGRVSSVRASGTAVVRPCGQFQTSPGSDDIHFGPEPSLDFEAELGVWLRTGNRLGEPWPVARAGEAMFGCCLVNDWSARAIQQFESMLGPYLSKSFLTSVSPWIVTMEALAPFRVAARGRDKGEPAIMPHLLDLSDRAGGALNIEVTADLSTAHGGRIQITRTNTRHLFWTLAQMIAHQASNGAPLESGDLVASGTLSGPADDSRACLAEFPLQAGRRIILSDGSGRSMLEDGDTVILRGRAIAEGFVSIGFGHCEGTIHPAPACGDARSAPAS